MDAASAASTVDLYDNAGVLVAKKGTIKAAQVEMAMKDKENYGASLKKDDALAFLSDVIDTEPGHGWVEA
eukprot:SAG22_NODE_713_length_7726_cov_10.328701_7_plen_70_part_00